MKMALIHKLHIFIGRNTTKYSDALLYVKLLFRHGPFYLINKIRLDQRNSILISKQLKHGLNVAGYFDNIFGTGEAARAFVRLIRNYKIKYSLMNLHAGFHPMLKNNELREFDFYYVNKLQFEKSLIFANGNVLKNIFNSNPELRKSHYVAAVWWWEYEDGMEEFKPGFNYINEVVVFNEFVKKAVTRILPSKTNLTKLPYPFIPYNNVKCDRNQALRKYKIIPDRFIFYYNFDFASSMWRKNPIGVMKAFEKAFISCDNVHLILKTTNHKLFPCKAKEFMLAISENKLYKNITWVSKALSRFDHINLLDTIDCYISLHRGEGLGLGLLEAMYLGKPVIATNYGGNLEFTKPNNSMLVDYTIRPCKDDYIVYKHVTQCAEPDIEQAVYYMRSIYEDPNKRISLGLSAQKEIQLQYNPDNCVAVYRKWIAGLNH